MRVKPSSILLCVWLILLSYSCCLAQTSTIHSTKQHVISVPGDPVLSVRPSDLKQFHQALNIVANRGKVTLVAESIPLRSSAVARAKTDDLIPKEQTLAEAITYIADTFDYRAERAGNVFLMRKRYSDPKDTPFLSLAEAKQATDDLLESVRPFNPHLPFGRPEKDGAFRSALASLSPEQLTLLKAEKLKVSSLSATQREQVRRFALHFFVEYGAVNALEFLRDGLNDLLTRKVEVGWGTNRDVWTFGYKVASDAAQGGAYFSPLAAPAAPQAQNGPSSLPPTTSLEGDANSVSGMPPFTPAGPTTLRALAAALNANRGADEPTLTVDDAFADKPVTVAGAAASPEALFRACAAVYGLRVVSASNGQVLRMTRRALRRPLRATDLNAAARAALPDPLLRAFLARSADQEKASKQDPTAFPAQGPSVIQASAAQRLRLLIGPRVKRSDDSAVLPLTDLNPAEQSLLTVAVVCQYVTSIRELFAPDPPPYVTNFDKLVLGGGPYIDSESNEPRFSLVLKLPQREGGSRLLAGMSNLDYTPQQP